MTVAQDFSYSYADKQQEFSISFGDIESEGKYYARVLGQKQYELKDHLGNVRVLVSDRKLLEDRNQDGEPEVRAEVLASYNYYPFGMQHPGRTYEGSAEYRFGFNGKEKDNSFGVTNYDYGFRIYNPQIAKFLSVDPLTKEYPWYTPYQFAGNKPVWAVDLDGLEEWYTWQYWEESVSSGTTQITKFTNNKIEETKNAVGNKVFKLGGEVNVSLGAQMSLEVKKVAGATVNLGSVELLSVKYGIEFSSEGFDGTLNGNLIGGSEKPKGGGDLSGGFKFTQQLSGSAGFGGLISDETVLTSSGGDEGGVGFEHTKVKISAGVLGVSATDEHNLTQEGQGKKVTIKAAAEASGALFLGVQGSFGLSMEEQMPKK